MKDVQGEKDSRKVPLKHVGIRELHWPLRLKDRDRGEQSTVGKLSLAVDLPHDARGTHMSRLVECLQDVEVISSQNIESILDGLKRRLGAERAMMDVEFPYFIYKKAPVSGLCAPLDIYCGYHAEKTGEYVLRLRVDTPIITLCPCSKEISCFGAHNQRATARIEVEAKGRVWFEEIAEIAAAGGSSQIYSLLKRPDEKAITEEAYENPRFVEDAVREIALRLERHPRVVWYRVEVDSLESIHNHNAFACVEKGWLT
ncbi:MAG: GTP cyclohydrolase FolE2 [Acidaminococcales bacterium]|jgi:GTP cyclohydrolase I|nr:GTP cyclohydrolase FolE2 [Acidaminococcales bacterium]